MSPQFDWKDAKRIFDQAAEFPSGKRAVFLESACQGNPGLQRRVESMLEEFDKEHETQPLEPPCVAPQDLDSDSGHAEFPGTDRFVVQRQLGSGAFGTVYQVWDREQQTTLALKVLRSRNPDVLFRFKREFRALVDVRHPNLVRLYELFSQGEHWFFSMELVEGANFLKYIRPDAGQCDLDRLRSCLRQLVEGVQALHASKKLHRDLKPGNALVTRSGRVVILDFGLVRELDLKVSESQTMVAGTPAYMAPEQAMHGAQEPSDWYAVGVMMFQALTGSLPAESSLGLLAQNFFETLREPRQIDPDIPADLNDLCRRLLHRSAAERPDAAAILTALGPAPAQAKGEDAIEYHTEVEHFVGRSEQLVELKAAFADTREGRFTVVLMHGRSGIGKTALMNRFLAMLAERDASLIVLKGRCYEFETVPYKGLDALVDELGRYMQRLPEDRVDALLPRDAFLLTKLFPVLGRVKAIANAPVRSNLVPDAQELRQRTFAALRELLTRVSDRHPLVIWIDDLQWGDRDSSTFLADLCAPPQQPALLLVLSYRSEDLASNATLQYLHQILANQRVVGNWRQIVLGELNTADTQQLFDELLPQETVVSPTAQAKIVEEAGGHPLFLQQLVRFASLRGAAGPAPGLAIEEWNLRTVLRQRAKQLPPLASEILEFICIAAQPLTISVLFAAAEAGALEERPETLDLLIREKFVRSSSSSGGRRVEPFHDQIRTVIAESLTPETRRARHRRLAAILAEQPDVEPQVLVTHYQEAGDLPAAYAAALRAAEFAEHQLAFDRAAVFYETALATGHDPEHSTELWRKLGKTLGLAGRGRDSAHAFLKAAESNHSLELNRLAAEQLMRSGYIDEALELFEKLAGNAGIFVPRTPAQAVRGMLRARISARVRLFFGVPKPTARPLKTEDMERLELLRTAGFTLNIADPVLATYFQTLHVVEALKLRDATHMSLALSVESSIRVAGGTRDPSDAYALLDQAGALARSTGNPNAVGNVYLVRAYLDYLLCRVPEGIEHGREAVKFLRENCTGAAWEITAAYVLTFWSMCWAGRAKEVREQLPGLLKEGAARGDVNMEVSLRLLSFVHYYYLSLDQPHECLRESKRALARWSRKGYHLQHYGAMCALVESYLYLGDYQEARRYLLADWEVMSRSFILRWQTLLIMALFLRGRVALACWLETRSDRTLRAEVEDYAKRLQKIRCSWGRPTSLVLKAGLAAGDGRNAEAARMLEEAGTEFEKISLHGYAAAAFHLAGRLEASRAKSLNASAALFWQSEGVVNPTAFMRMYLPGVWVTEDRAPAN